MFGRKREGEKLPQDFHRLSTGDSDLEKQVRDLTARLDQVEAQHKLIRNEWNDTYDKVCKATERLRKRQEVAEATAPDIPENNEPLNRHKLLARWQRR